MVKFIFRRILYIFLVLFLVSFFIFLVYQSMPGDPALIWMEGREQELTPAQWEEALAEITRTMGLDRPIPIRFGLWIGAMFRGDFGISLASRLPVLEVVRAPMLNTVVINILNLILVFSITVPAGIYCAVRRGKAFDNAALVFSMIGLSMPTMVFALILIVLFAVLIPIFPTFGMASVIQPERWTIAFFRDRLFYMALPLMTMTLTSLAGLLRYMRSAMIDTLNMDFVRTARSKGLMEKTVIFTHAFRNALIPVITIMTSWFITIFGGSVIVERLFMWNGMGDLFVTALLGRDLAVAMSLSVFYSLIAFVGWLFMDIAYVIVDPRIRFE